MSPTGSFFNQRGVSIPFFKFSGILAEALLALLACKDLFPTTRKVSPGLAEPFVPSIISPYHLLGLLQHMRFLLLVAFGAVKPFFALVEGQSVARQGYRIWAGRTARRPNGHLRIKNVFTARHGC